MSSETDANGQLTVTFTPDIAGTYVMSNEYAGPGGLLATFYRTKDFTDPVLENSAYAIEVNTHVQAPPGDCASLFFLSEFSSTPL